MKIEESKYSIAELIDMFKRKDLFVNESYQRAPRLWPPGARSYFIDTILNNYPFPKIYFNEMIDRESKRPRRELVDGQQRFLSIFDFFEGRYALGKNSQIYQGLKFADLTEDQQTNFLSYTVSVDVIRGGSKQEILQMFRRMNAYTLPLNDAEKRHAEYFGEFKDWVGRILDNSGALLSTWGILSDRQIVRMADAEFISEIILEIEGGITSSSPKKLRDIYEKYDTEFIDSELYFDMVSEVFLEITTSFSQLQNTYICKNYVFLSLIISMIHLKWGIPDFEKKTGIKPQGTFYVNLEAARENLYRLAVAHETKDLGEFKDYVLACQEGANRERQRLVRSEFICKALLNNL